MEHFSFCSDIDFGSYRLNSGSQVDLNHITDIGGSDIDPSAVGLAKRHMKQAGLGNHVSLSVLPLQEVLLDRPGGVFICNPPYGERMDSRENVRRLYRDLSFLRNRHPGWSLCAISSDPGFEKSFGKKADRKRRLYNGRLECTYYTYFGTSRPESF